MRDPVQQVTGVLDHRLVDLHLDLDGAAVDVVGVGAAIGRCFGDLALLALTLVLRDDRLEANAFLVESTAEPFERGWC